MRHEFVDDVVIEMWIIIGQWSFSSWDPALAAGVGLCSRRYTSLKGVIQGVSAAEFKAVSIVQTESKTQCLQHLVNARPLQHFTNKVCLVQDFQHKTTQHELELGIHSR